MKSRTLLALAAFIIAAAALPLHAVTISQWTFESSVPTTAGPLSPEVGSGAAIASHLSTAAYSNPAGNGSTESWSSDHWAAGDYYQFQLSTIGFDTIFVTWDQMRSSTGPSTFDFAYSLNGVNFTMALDNYAVSSSSWSAFSEDMSSLLTLNNTGSIYFRLIADSSPSGTSGTARIDNFTVTGNAITTSNPVPDTLPFTFTACFLFSFLAFAHKIGGLKEPAPAKSNQN